MLPRRDGLEVLRELRGAHRTTPVLLLSARGEVRPHIAASTLGRNDYLPKPFVLAEVVARVRALARREFRSTRRSFRSRTSRSTSSRGCAPRWHPPGTQSARAAPPGISRAGKGPRLHPRRAAREVWDYRAGYDPGSNVVQVAVMRLRDKVDAPFPTKLIHTVFFRRLRAPGGPMKIRTRLTLWYAGMLLGSLLLMGGVLHYELVGEYEKGRPPESPSVKIADILIFYGCPR